MRNNIVSLLLLFFLFLNRASAQELVPNIDQVFEGFSSYTFNDHAHTNCSDGELAPLEEVVEANLSTTAQILALTDHSEQLSRADWQIQGNLSRQRWNLLRGFELTGTEIDNFTKLFQPYNTPGWGHVLVYRTNVTTASRISDDGEPPSLSESYDEALAWLENHPQALAVFAHPSLYRTETSFGGFKKPPSDRLIRQFFGCELSAHGFPESYVGLGDVRDGLRSSNEACLRELLRKGWRVAPTMGGDQHRPPYGNVTTLTGLWLKEPISSSLSVYEAMEARRCFATEDPRARIKFIAFQGDKVVMMGQGLSPATGPVMVKCKVEGVAVIRITLVGISQIGLDFDFETVSQDLENERQFFGDDISLNLLRNARIVCIYAKAELANGKHIVSAPIWLQGAF